jgi:hypothetical protein
MYNRPTVSVSALRSTVYTSSNLLPFKVLSGAFATKVLNMRPLASPCLSVCPHVTNWAPMNWSSRHVIRGNFTNICQQIPADILHKGLHAHLAQNSLNIYRRPKAQDKILAKNGYIDFIHFSVSFTALEIIGWRAPSTLLTSNKYSSLLETMQRVKNSSTAQCCIPIWITLGSPRFQSSWSLARVPRSSYWYGLYSWQNG